MITRFIDCKDAMHSLFLYVTKKCCRLATKNKRNCFLNRVAAPSDGLGGRCHQYAVVGDSNSRHETNVCSGDKQRDRHVHKSSGTSADVRMTTRADVTNTNSVYFLLYFEGIFIFFLSKFHFEFEVCLF